jgi:hypothetical protein
LYFRKKHQKTVDIPILLCHTVFIKEGEKDSLKRSKIMIKFSVIKNGKVLDPSLYNWDENTKTFSTKEDGLVLDFTDFIGVTFKTGSECTFNTGSYCAFYTGSYCTFDTGPNCTFDTGYKCTFKTWHDCAFKTGYYCTFNTGVACTFNTGFDCTFNTSSSCTFNTGQSCTFNTSHSCTFDTGSECTFKTGFNCTFKTGSDCIFEVGDNCFVTRFDVKGVTEIPTGKKIKLNGHKIDGYTIIKEKKETPTCNGKVVGIDGKQYKLSKIKK